MIKPHSIQSLAKGMLARAKGMLAKLGSKLGVTSWAQLATRLSTRFWPKPGQLEVLLALGDQVLVSGMTFAIGIGVARLLGITDFGKLAIVFILQMFAQSFQGCFVVAPMMALTGLRGRRTSNYFAAVMAWSAVLSVTAGAGVALAAWAIYAFRDGGVPAGFVLAAGAYTVTQNLLYTVRRMLFAKRIGWQAFYMDAGRYLLFLAGMLVIWLQGYRIDVTAVLWALALSGLTGLVPLFLRLRGARLSRAMLTTVWSRHWPFSQWLALMLILTFGQDQAIALSLGATLSDAAIGGLRAGQYLIGVTHFIWVALENFVPGGASRAFASGGTEALQGYLRRTTRVLGVVVWGFILLVSLPAETSLELAFGAGYEQFAPILRLYGLTYAIAFFREVWVFYFYAIQRTDVIFRAFVLGFAVAMLAVFPAIKILGVTGAALTVLLANTASTAYIMLNAWKSIRDSRATAPNLPLGANTVLPAAPCGK